jgi:hypothetical protein
MIEKMISLFGICLSCVILCRHHTFEGSQSEADMKTIKSWSFRHLALHPTLPRTLIFTNISKLPLLYINYTLLYTARLCILS